jgi:hypothetical protein
MRDFHYFYAYVRLAMPLDHWDGVYIGLCLQLKEIAKAR